MGSPKRDFLPFIKSRVTQTRPRRVLKLCALLSCVGFCMATIGMGSLTVFLNPPWWLLLISLLCAALPFGLSFLACFTGKTVCITALSMGSFLNVCAAISVMCIIMTEVSEAARVAETCAGDGKANRPPDCSSFSNVDIEYLTTLAAKRAVVTGLVTLYGTGCVILNGFVMVHSFFLARRCRSRSANWLTTSPTLSFKGVKSRSVSHTSTNNTPSTSRYIVVV